MCWTASKSVARRASGARFVWSGTPAHASAGQRLAAEFVKLPDRQATGDTLEFVLEDGHGSPSKCRFTRSARRSGGSAPRRPRLVRILGFLAGQAGQADHIWPCPIRQGNAWLNRHGGTGRDGQRRGERRTGAGRYPHGGQCQTKQCSGNRYRVHDFPFPFLTFADSRTGRFSR